MNIVFAGTPHFGIPSLDVLLQSTHQLLAIYTQPDRPAGRGHKLQPSPVKIWALQHQLPVYQPLNFKTQESINDLVALAPDIMVVIAYGLILPPSILEIPKYGCINVHASLLPRWRGASPIQQAILNQDTQSGISIMQMNSGMDTGDILTTVPCLIDSRDTSGTLHDKLAQLAPVPLLNVLNNIASDNIIPTPQNNKLATYAPKINKEDAAIDWTNSATHIDFQIRAFNPWPTAYTHANGETIKIHQATVLNAPCSATPGTILAISRDGIQVATGQHILLIDTLQFAGGKAIKVSDWLNSNRSHLHVNMILQ